MFLKTILSSLMLLLLINTTYSNELLTHCDLEKKEIASLELSGIKLVDVYMNKLEQRCAVFINDKTSNKDLSTTDSNASTFLKFKVYDDFDSPDNLNNTPLDDGIKAQLDYLSRTYPDMIKKQIIGHSHQSKPIIALKLSDKNNESIKKENVLFIGLHHAREWVTVDHLMRFLYWSVNPDNHEFKELLKNVNVWVIPVLNPDGYQFTFTSKGRNWRKNCRDNNGNGVFEMDEDGVDLNRNFSYLWGFDEWGATKNPTGWSYRGPTPFSEPETKALKNFMLKHKFLYAISYHTYGNMILYPNGYLPEKTPADWPIFQFLAGTRKKPAIKDSTNNSLYAPMLSSQLYTTNGDFSDWAYNAAKVISFTVELTDSEEHGFNYPDDEGLLKTVFEDNLPFMLDLIKSGADKDHPYSHINSTLKDFVHTPIKKSFGNRQVVEVFSKKESPVQVNYYDDNNNYNTTGFRKLHPVEQGVFFDRQHAVIFSSKKTVNYWFDFLQQNGESVSYPSKGSYQYQIIKSEGKKALLVSAEQSTGTHKPKYLNQYITALNQTDLKDNFDVYIKSADEVINYFEVLIHYDLIIWYTGDTNHPWNYGQEHELVRFFREANGKMFFLGSMDNGNLPEGPYYSSSIENILNYYFGVGTYIKNLGHSFLQNDQSITGYPSDPIFKGRTIKLDKNRLNESMGLLNSSNVAGISFSNTKINSVDVYSYDLSNSNEIAESIISTKVTIPSNQKKTELIVNMFYRIDGVTTFLEIEDLVTNKRESIPPIKGVCEYPAPSIRHIDPLVFEDLPILKNYYDNDGNMIIFENEIPAIRALCWTEGKLAPAQFDLTKYKGKEIIIRYVYISFGDGPDEGDIGLVESIKIDGISSESYELTYSGNWIKGLSENIKLAPTITTDNTILFTFGLESIDSKKDRDFIIKNAIKYLK